MIQNIPPLPIRFVLATCVVALAASCATPDGDRSTVASIGGFRTIRGVVLEADGKTPAANVEVFEGKWSQTGWDHWIWSPDEWMQSCAPDAKKTDAAGKFELQHISNGDVAVIAARNRFSWTELGPVHVIAGATTDVRVVLRPERYLVGRIVAPPGASLDGFVVGVIPSGCCGNLLEERTPHWPTSQAMEARVSPTGEFRVGPLSALTSVYPYAGRRGGSMGDGDVTRASVPLEEIGDTRYEFDLRDLFPGRLEVHVKIDGAPPTSAVDVIVHPPEFDWSRKSDQSPVESGLATFDALAGGEWLVTIRPRSEEWIYTSPTPVHVAPAGRSACWIDCRVHRGTLRILDRAGAPIEGDFGLRQSGETSHWVLTTNANGSVTIRLPIAKYELTRGFPLFGNDPVVATIDWTANGPVPATVTLK